MVFSLSRAGPPLCMTRSMFANAYTAVCSEDQCSGSRTIFLGSIVRPLPPPPPSCSCPLFVFQFAALSVPQEERQPLLFGLLFEQTRTAAPPTLKGACLLFLLSCLRASQPQPAPLSCCRLSHCGFSRNTPPRETCHAKTAVRKPQCENRNAKTVLRKPRCENRTAKTVLRKPQCENRDAKTVMRKP